jgi:hypothetical protein
MKDRIVRVLPDGTTKELYRIPAGQEKPVDFKRQKYFLNAKKSAIETYGVPETEYERTSMSPAEGLDKVMKWLMGRNRFQRAHGLNDLEMSSMEDDILTDLGVEHKLYQYIKFARKQGASDIEIIQGIKQDYTIPEEYTAGTFPDTRKRMTEEEKRRTRTQGIMQQPIMPPAGYRRMLMSPNQQRFPIPPHPPYTFGGYGP